MSADDPYRATPDELRRIDEALLDIGGPPIPDDKLPEFYRAEAVRLRAEANVAETVEMRIAFLEAAETADRLAKGFSDGASG